MSRDDLAERVFGNRSRVRVLRVLRGVRVPLNASQIAARTGLTHPAVTSAIETLGALGIVSSSPAGRATVHWLERENAYVREMVDPVFETETSLVDLIAEWLRDEFTDETESVVLYGSYARGEETADSDVDVVLVGADDAAVAHLERTSVDAIAAFRRSFGATLSPVVYHRDDAAALRTRAPGLALEIERDGVTVSGRPADRWAEDADAR